MPGDLIVEDAEFYMVWTKTGHIPRKMHNTREAAEAEADRLARLLPHGKKYIVLRGYRKCHVPPAPAACPPASSPAAARVPSEGVA